MRRRRRMLVGVVVAGVLLLGVALAVAAGGRFDRYKQLQLVTRAARLSAPAWTRPCWGVPYPGNDCIRLTGRVVWAQAHDSDGDGDRHLIVVSRLHVAIVKLRRGVGDPGVPNLGSVVRATGVTKRGASGRMEIDATVFAEVS